MSTAVIMRPAQVVAAAPAVKGLTGQLSLNLVKNLLRITISNITYLRAMFDEGCYEDCVVEGQPLKMLRKLIDKRADTLMSWADACFEALEKQYLRQAVLAVFNDVNNPETLVESYTFKFEYRNMSMAIYNKQNEKIATATNAEEVKKATLKMLRTLVVLTQMLKPMQEGQYVTMRLFYYDDVTPMGYQPSGFKESDDRMSFAYEEKPLNIKAGDIATEWHQLKLRVKTCKTQLIIPEEINEDEDAAGKEIDADMDNEVPVIHAHPQVNKALGSGEHTNGNVGEFEDDVNMTEEEQRVPDCNVQMSHPPTKMDTETQLLNQEPSLQCPCGIKKTRGPQLVCTRCHSQVHAACHGFRSSISVESTSRQRDFQCLKCSGVFSSDLEAETFALWRQTVDFLLENNSISSEKLHAELGVPLKIADGLMDRLIKDGLISRTKDRKNPQLGHKVVRAVLEKQKLETLLFIVFSDVDVDHVVEPLVPLVPDHVDGQEGSKLKRKSNLKLSSKPAVVESVAIETSKMSLDDPKEKKSIGGKRKISKLSTTSAVNLGPAFFPSQCENSQEMFEEQTTTKKRFKSSIAQDQLRL